MQQGVNEEAGLIFREGVSNSQVYGTSCDPFPEDGVANKEEALANELCLFCRDAVINDRQDGDGLCGKRIGALQTRDGLLGGAFIGRKD